MIIKAAYNDTAKIISLPAKFFKENQSVNFIARQDKEPASADWYYPLQTLNIFELTYWFLLAFGIYKVTKLDFGGSSHLVLFLCACPFYIDFLRFILYDK